MSLRTTWVRLNCLRTGAGRFHSCLYKWSMTSSAVCECGAEEQTIDHVVHNVQSIDPMVCMAWRCWTMRQLNVCSTSAPIASAAKQWFEKLAQKKKNLRQKCQVQDCQNKDRLSEYRMLLLQRKPKLGRTKPSTGPHAVRGLDAAVLN